MMLAAGLWLVSRLAILIGVAMALALSIELKAKVQKMIDITKESLNVVSGVQALIDLLEKHNLIYKVKANILQIGVHRLNRDGYGLNAQDCHDLMDDYISVGFSKRAIFCICVEAEDEDLKFNDNLVREADGALGHIEINGIRYVTLSASHTCFSMRLIMQRVAHSGDPRICVDGKLCPVKASTYSEQLAEVLKDGLDVIVFPRELVREVPDLPGLVQSMGNAGLQRGEHDVQMLLRLHQLITAAQQHPTGRPDFAQIKTRALASKPRCGAAVPGMYHFVMNCSSGTEGKKLKETAAMVRAHASSKASLPANVYEALAEDPKSMPPAGRLHAVHAMLLSAYLYGNVTLGEVRKLHNKDNVPKVLEANKLMVDLRGIIDGIDAGSFAMDPKVKSVLGFADIYIISICLKMKIHKFTSKLGEAVEKFVRAEYKTIQGVAHSCIEALKTITKHDVTNGFAKDDMPEAKPQPCDQAVAKRRLQTYDGFSYMRLYEFVVMDIHIIYREYKQPSIYTILYAYTCVYADQG
jgi:hypothetical protein